MKQYCVDSTRVVLPLFQEDDGGSTPTSTLQLHIARIGITTAKRLNAKWHSRLPVFETGFCQNGWAYAASFKNVYYACAIWSNPVAPLLPQHQWLELRRFAIAPDAPKNTASRMLSVMALLIRHDFPAVDVLVSYQDEEAHKGTIYAAAGWQATTKHSGGSWNRPNSKNLSGTPRTRPDLNGATGPKIRWEKRVTRLSARTPRHSERL